MALSMACVWRQLRVQGLLSTRSGKNPKLCSLVNSTLCGLGVEAAAAVPGMQGPRDLFADMGSCGLKQVSVAIEPQPL